MRVGNHLRSLLTVLVLAASVGACDAISGRETPGEYTDDTVITSKVIAEIIKDPSLSKMQVNVETFRNVVQLSGFVATTQEASRAGDLARNVSGVQSVRNDLIVR